MAERQQRYTCPHCNFHESSLFPLLVSGLPGRQTAFLVPLTAQRHHLMASLRRVPTRPVFRSHVFVFDVHRLPRLLPITMTERSQQGSTRRGHILGSIPTTISAERVKAIASSRTMRCRKSTSSSKFLFGTVAPMASTSASSFVAPPLIGSR